MLRNLDRRAAARFAFLMSIPVMLAAGGYEMLDVIRMPDLVSLLPVIIAGFLTAAVIGWFAVKWLIEWITNHSLYIFAGYCAVLGVAVLLFQILG
jgi:undecaprenyl-diphosphatase